MSLHIVSTKHERLVSAPVLSALHTGLDSCGKVVLLVPSFAQALDVQKLLAKEPGLSLSVAVTTPGAWVKERWEVWGDGRTIADATVLSALSYLVLRDAPPEDREPIELSHGLVAALSRLADRALPWLPLDQRGEADFSSCMDCGLTRAETRLIGLVGSLRELLHQRGYLSSSEAFVAVPRALHEAGASVPRIVVAGFGSMERRERELICSLSEMTDVTFVARICEGPASSQVRSLVTQLGGEVQAVDDLPVEENPQRSEELSRLLGTLFTGEQLDGGPGDGVELLQASGPVAEAELVVLHLERVLSELPGARVIIATPDLSRAHRELLPKLAARGISARVKWSDAFLGAPAAQAFFSFAHTVARLQELERDWPEPEMGIEGPMIQLGDMSWWPPRELTDFLLSQISHLDAARAWRLDASWRGNRVLTPKFVLEMLQSEREVGECVARATAELLRGRVGSAASKLLLPFLRPAGEGTEADERSEEGRAVLQAIMQLAGTLRELGVTADPTQPNAVSLVELLELIEWAAEGMGIVSRLDVLGEGDARQICVMTPGEASRQEACSADVVVVCGLTTAESPIKAPDDLITAVLELLHVEAPSDSMADARASFRSLVQVPTTRLVLERALHDADSKPTYPSVMLSELLSCYPSIDEHGDATRGIPTSSLPETNLSRNLAPSGEAPAPSVVNDPAPAGRLTDASRRLVFVPQDGSTFSEDERPVLSASQIETYLDCPYKWFSLRRLRLGTVDAGFGGMEMGTFAHRVLEVTHREMLLRALEAGHPEASREELLAEIMASPERHVPSSRINEENLEDARIALELEFDLHRQHMRMIRRPRVQQQLLIPHDMHEEEMEEQLKKDLLSTLGYETRILQGFEPRFFEWGFGRHGELVEYAGAYFNGTVDRIDVSPHGTAVILDYKHKSPFGFASEYDALQEGVLEGQKLPNHVQSLIYAQVVRRAFEGRLRLAGTVYLSTKSPHALAGAADENVADLVFGKLSSARAPRVCVPSGSGGVSGMEELLDRTEELVAEQVKQMLAGNVEARPRDKRSCDYCPVMQCERRVAR